MKYKIGDIIKFKNKEWWEDHAIKKVNDPIRGLIYTIQIIENGNRCEINYPENKLDGFWKITYYGRKDSVSVFGFIGLNRKEATWGIGHENLCYLAMVDNLLNLLGEE